MAFYDLSKEERINVVETIFTDCKSDFKNQYKTKKRSEILNAFLLFYINIDLYF